VEAQMTVKTTLSFTDRHHHFLSEKVGQGVFATQSAAVAAALERKRYGVPLCGEA
jgi:Arc/MetJ-type ribon-helix-helix transcriptional regulator